ncbi:ubiquinol oxidase subunit II, cyanide insensitive [Klebsiella sp. WP7-S18-CRE-02]|uniref:Cytochrome d ubiquinol oxidase subunit II n=1 Tax=Kluyvera genomosp. 2 TaxID=2774054 RepID=A0A2T2XYK4_9ENTR|nr:MULTISPECIES: cytochrome d ubiquinol oxidase subunit II [Enterobacteriaceae]HAT3919538.1 cytochrome d ubiquinol oxidase subunit II [Kluyvera ascorbata]PSR45384.1 cytochrome d ubiquinol oxidase subunit II [Kluyvera genomosp. 2]BBQ83999.1 ubiquinol oxidase subunit II, cyanide insensitive [Klebsiella sp. WP3-W18-ESBL-02]BBR20952.1 ubiquinol oxidase subunit II, cyanide insensitive [Klebsiella sp. WP3-S18-ESBL-05]BBS91836.1 ubiquinol oxidase subunit II, cyanide insensitive [Klebsiella sp. WP7-S1
MNVDLSIVWFVIIVFATLMYIVMDGFDLGIGILFPFTRSAQERDVMVNSVAPVWDGNETWLVLGGAALFGAFPLAYAVIIDALTIPLSLMLIGLIFRGVAFEFRFNATPSHRPFWDNAFMGGSMLATFCQGVVVGAVINGFPVSQRAFSGGPFDWLTPFSLFCGVGLVIAYALLGATWLVMKSEAALQSRMRRAARGLLLALLAVMAIISAWTPLQHAAIAARWFSLPNLYSLLPVPLLVLAASGALWHQLALRESHVPPFILTLALVFLGFSGLGISIWPAIIPPSITLWQAAAPQQSQEFMLIGAIFIIPVILAYTFWSYYVFRGKVPQNEGYH